LNDPKCKNVLANKTFLQFEALKSVFLQQRIQVIGCMSVYFEIPDCLLNIFLLVALLEWGYPGGEGKDAAFPQDAPKDHCQYRRLAISFLVA
jgi:hypothetical protein